MKTVKRETKRRICPCGALLMVGALMLGGCSQDEGSELAGGDPVAVQFISQMVGQSSGLRSAPGTRSAGAEITSRGVTSSGLEYIDYVAADGFPTREIFPPGSTAQSGGAGMQTRTTVAGDQWVAGDKVGIFMLTNGGTLPDDIASGGDNIQYNTTPDGGDAAQASFAPVNTGETIYYPQSGTVDFIAYYPYRATPAAAPYIYNVSVADQENPAAIDVLRAIKTDVTKSSTAVNLGFSHVLSKITLNVLAGDGIAADISGLAASEVTFGGMPVEAELTLQDGTLSASTSTQAFNPQKAETASDGFQATFSAILVPQPTADTYTGRTVVFTVDGQDYTWTIPHTETFAAGNNYTYRVTVEKSGITVGDPAIIPWTGTEGTPSPGTSEIVAVKIPAAGKTFSMGEVSIAEPVHSVSFTKDFYMGKYQVTNAQYAAFLNAADIKDNGLGPVTYYDKDGKRTTETLRFIYDSSTEYNGKYDWGLHWNTDKWEPASGCDDHPVIYVTWYGAKAYADWVGGALPTEAQWEYACRAGTTTAFYSGDYYATLGAYCWYSANSGGTTHEVGKTTPNGYGLYDMHGNVLEWCSDLYASYESEPDTDPTGPDTSPDSYRVLRGGSWGNHAQVCRSAYRINYSPQGPHCIIGFRVVFLL